MSNTLYQLIYEFHLQKKNIYLFNIFIVQPNKTDELSLVSMSDEMDRQEHSGESEKQNEKQPASVREDISMDVDTEKILTVESGQNVASTDKQELTAVDSIVQTQEIAAESKPEIVSFSQD